MESRDLIALMAAIIFAAKANVGRSHETAVEDALKLFKATGKVKTSEVLRFG